MTTGERIKALRLEKGLSQEELGRLVGVQRAAINKYEKGLVVNLKRDTANRLAQALGTTPAALMGWAEEDAPPPPQPEELTEEERAYLKWFREHATDRDKELIRRLINGGR